MKTKDLGKLDGPVLLYGGTYSNLQATQALFAWADAQGIPPGRRVCTGDIVAYGANPVETAELVLSRGGTVVAGNCEKQLAEDAETCGCGFAAGSTCDVLSKGWYPFARAALADRADLRDAFAACPDIVVFTRDRQRYAVIHGGVTDIARFVWPCAANEVFEEEIAALEHIVGPVDVVVAGHAGIRFTRRLGSHSWINAGVIGLPENNGTPSTAFVVLGADGPRYHQLDYDAESAAAAMRAAGLTQGYEASLLSGHWPSEDILPREMRRAIA